MQIVIVVQITKQELGIVITGKERRLVALFLNINELGEAIKQTVIVGALDVGETTKIVVSIEPHY